MVRPDCPPDSALVALHVGGLGDDDLDAVADHLDACPPCDDRFRRVERGYEDPLLSALRLPPWATPDPATQLTVDFGPRGRNEPRPSGSREDRSLGVAARSDLPARIGRYRVTGLLGRGGMGVVYRADDPDLGRAVALKVLGPRFAADPDARVRFVREGRAAAGVKGDHVVAVYDAGEAAGVPYLAMELLAGESVGDWLRRTDAVPEAEVLRVGREAALGLLAAHAKGLVHRDIKPTNLWLEAPGRRVKVLDFGLAVGEAGGDPRLTRDGFVVGTPGYLAPEQADGRPLDARTDLFALGCVLYRLATGRTAFAGDTPLALLNDLATRTPPPPRRVNPAVSPALSDLIVRLLARNPTDRPASVALVIVAIRAIEAGATGTRSRGRRWVVPSAVAGALAALVVVQQFRPPEGMPPVPPTTPDIPAPVPAVVLPPPREPDPNEQARAVTAELRRLNPKFTGEPTWITKDGAVTGYFLPADGLTDLSPIAALTGLTELRVNGTNRNPRQTFLQDLSPLRGLKLRRIECSHTYVDDLNPLRGMPLIAVLVEGTAVEDLSPLRGKLLWELWCGNSYVKDLEPVRGMPLHELRVAATRITTLDPVRGADKLHTVFCDYSDVTSLAPLAGKPLRFLGFEGTPVTDLSPLAGCPLENVAGPIDPARDAAVLRGMPTLRTINRTPADLFWRAAGK